MRIELEVVRGCSDVVKQFECEERCWAASAVQSYSGLLSSDRMSSEETELDSKTKLKTKFVSRSSMRVGFAWGSRSKFL